MKDDRLTEMLTPIASELGLECLGVEYSPAQGAALVRVYIDVPDRPVNVDDCESASRRFAVVLDEKDPIAGHYTLEVSSPGLDRPLFTLDHFKRFIGSEVKLTLNFPILGRRRFQGPVREVSGNTITLLQDGELVDIAHDNVQKARLVPNFGRKNIKTGKTKKTKESGLTDSGSGPSAVSAGVDENE